MKEQSESNLRDMITLRPCILEDSLFYYNVKKITLKQYVEQTWGVWDERYQRERHKKNFIPENTQIIQIKGLDIGILVSEENSETMMIHNIEILPEYQNQGIGSHLLNKIIQEAIERDKYISLQVFKTNPKARNLYQRLGFFVEAENETHFKMRYL